MIHNIDSDPEFQKDVIEWDIFNWTRAVKFWEKELSVNSVHHGVGLELGSRRGGLSLYFARNGYHMTATDIREPDEEYESLQAKYHVQDMIRFQTMAAGAIRETDHFDLITFKSVLGAVCSNGHTEKLEPVIRNIHQALKPGGSLVFAENLYATAVHHILRKRMVKWGNKWNYLHPEDIEHALQPFSAVKITTVGFFACFGRNERQKRWLGKLDQLLEFMIPGRSRYIMSVVATK